MAVATRSSMTRLQREIAELAVATRSSMMRLQREITELEQEPLEGIQYHMHEGDITRMCLILSPASGPFRDLRLHLSVKIPDLYPQDPPQVTIQTSVTHPNVIGNEICCDILRPASEGRSEFYNGGYTPAYLLKYIFLQLLSFFSAYKVEQDYGGEVEVLAGRFRMSVAIDEVSSFRESMRKVVQGFPCIECGFNITVPSVVEHSRRDSRSIIAAGKSGYDAELGHSSSVSAMCALNDDCWLPILDRLSDQDMFALSSACAQAKEVVKKHNLVIRRQLVCFYLRKTFTEAVLGIGLDAVAHEIASKRGVPATVRVLDLFSYEAFKEHGVRTGIYGERFNVFLPVALEDHHFLRAEPILVPTLEHLHRVFVRPQKLIHGALCVVEVLPRLINRLVLDLVKDCDVESTSSTLRRHRPAKKASEKALQGYCLLLHLFAKLAKRYPVVEAELRRRVTVFRQSDAGRHKDATPNIGEFLTYLCVLKEDWQSYCTPFIEELLARNVVWFLEGRNAAKKYPHLAHLEDDSYVSLQRLRETFEASAASMRMVMFQVSFLRLAQSVDTFSQYGYPSGEMNDALFHQTRRIYAVKDWDECMSILGFQLPTSMLEWRPRMCKMLKRAVTRSEIARYHVVPYSPQELYYLRARAEPSCPRPSWWTLGNPVRCNLVGFERQSSSRSFFPESRW